MRELIRTGSRLLELMARSLELQHPTFPDAPTQVVAEEDQALGKAEADQERPQARDVQVLRRRAFATISSEGSAIGETSASIFTRLDRHRHKPCMFWKKGKCNKGDKCLFRHDGPPGKPSGFQGHQAMSPQAQPLLLRMVSPGRLLLLLSAGRAEVVHAVRKRRGLRRAASRTQWQRQRSIK